MNSNPTSPCTQSQLSQGKQEANPEVCAKRRSPENGESPPPTNIGAQPGRLCC